jgi:hypothetical protein
MPAIDIFTREEFEQALPVHETTRERLWRPLGLTGSGGGEYTYAVPVIGNEVRILIRSSVRANERSADVGKDSIRCWLVDANSRPLGKKLVRWTTRLPGWQVRMTRILRQLYLLGLKLRCPCGRIGVYGTKNDEPFFWCPKKSGGCGRFVELTREQMKAG